MAAMMVCRWVRVSRRGLGTAFWPRTPSILAAMNSYAAYPSPAKITTATRTMAVSCKLNRRLRDCFNEFIQWLRDNLILPALRQFATAIKANVRPSAVEFSTAFLIVVCLFKALSVALGELPLCVVIR